MLHIVRDVTITLKLTTNCNMSCGYCYEKYRCQTAKQNHIMNAPEIIQRFIDLNINLGKIFSFNFGLHGGEPLLIGKDRYKKIISTAKYGVDHGCDIKIGIQTNGTLIDPEWAKLFRSSFSYLQGNLGISIDGPKYINDRYRSTKDGKSTFEKVSGAIDLLNNYGVKFGILMVIAQHNINNPKEVFDYIIKSKFSSVKFLPCLNATSNSNKINPSITSLEYGVFLIKIFELWLASACIDAISIDPLTALTKKLLGINTNWCEYEHKKCQNLITIYPTGDMYYCDTLIPSKKLLLGNINNMNDDKLLCVLKYVNDGFKKLLDIMTQKCQSCKIQNICCGGCIGIRQQLYNFDSKLFDNYCYGKQLLIKNMQNILSQILPRKTIDTIK